MRKKKIDVPREKFFKLLPAWIVVGWILVGIVASYLSFEVWMKLRLPKGFLEIGSQTAKLTKWIKLF